MVTIVFEWFTTCTIGVAKGAWVRVTKFMVKKCTEDVDGKATGWDITSKAMENSNRLVSNIKIDRMLVANPVGIALVRWWFISVACLVLESSGYVKLSEVGGG